MAAVKGKNTSPEIKLRKLVHRLGYRFRIHKRDLPGTPDLVFTRRRKIVLVHGCFWHRHPGCRKASTPTTHADFWQSKFARNIQRDRENEQCLRQLGWDVLTVWECETRDSERLSKILCEFLGPPKLG